MNNYINRKPIVSGRFYPAEKTALEQQLTEFFNHTNKNDTYADIQAIISPHAGYVYSGSVAADAYSSIDPNKKFDNIFILAPAHHIHFKGASIYNVGDYETPLGCMPVNITLANELINNNSCFCFENKAHTYEHSLEVQLPFIQHYFNNPQRMIPIVCGTSDINTLEKISDALKPYFNHKNLFIISSDFSHFLDYHTATQVDKEAAEAIVFKNIQEFIQTLRKNKKWENGNNSTTPCGFCGIVILKRLTENNRAYHYRLLSYKNSGDVGAGNKKRVVGYWAIHVEQIQK